MEVSHAEQEADSSKERVLAILEFTSDVNVKKHNFTKQALFDLSSFPISGV